MKARITLPRNIDLAMLRAEFGYPRDSVRLVSPEDYAAFMEAQG